MRFLIVLLLFPFFVQSQTIEILDDDPLMPRISVTVEDSLQDAFSTAYIPGLGKKYLTLTLVIDGRLSPVAVSGKYSYADGILYFQPHTKLGEDLEFEVQYVSAYNDVTAKYHTSGDPKSKAPRSKAEAVFPSSQQVPKNILFFHVRFSESMADNIHGYEYVKIFDASGTEIPKVWRQRSYWLENQKVLVLMVHPGRVKRGIDMSIPFEIGSTYTLVVADSLKDIQGRSLLTSFEKTFTFTDEDYTLPKVLFDDIILPETNSKEAIRLSFSEGMDHSSIVDGVKIRTEGNTEVQGSFTWDASDKQFQFHPSESWNVGKYTIVFKKIVCDFANNRLNRPFEISEIEEMEKDEIPVEFDFELK